MNWRFVWAMANRELRAARRRFVFYGSCMAIGIAVVVSLHSLRATVRQTIDARSQTLLGADLRLSSRSEFDAEIEAQLAQLAPNAVSRATRFGSMALAEPSGLTRLVDVNAIEGDFPFYGAITTHPPNRWKRLQGAEYQALVDPSLLLQLDARVGDTLVLGQARFTISAEIRRAPGGFGLQTQIAPRVFIARRYLDATGLVQLGSLVEHQRFLRVPRSRLEPWLEAKRSVLESARIRLQTVAGYQADMSRSFGALTRYLGLVGLAALALGVIGVASGVRVFVREKHDAVAVLRSLGARPREVVAVYSLLAIALGGAAGLAGILLCMPLVWGFPLLMRDVLPVDVAFRLDLGAMASGVVLGLWATAVCAIGPLLDLAGVAPLRALRRDFSVQDDGPRRGRALVVLAFGASLIGASIWQAPSLQVGLAFAAGIALGLAALAGCAHLAAETLRRHSPRNAPYWLRQGVANLFRPRNHTLPTTVGIGFALFLIATLHSVQHSVLAQVAMDTAPGRPNLVLFDVQLDQADALGVFLDERGARTIEATPLVSARLGTLRGEKSEAWLARGNLARDLRWALRREYRLTYRDDMRDSETLVAGRWWRPGASYPNGVVPVSIERDLALTLDLALGDRITWQVQGVPVESEVASIRKVDWGRLATNFFVVMPPAALEKAPQSQVVLAHLADANARAELQRDLVRTYPNVSALDASVILRAVDAMMAQLSMAIRLLALFMLGTGVAILVAAASAARSERMREVLLLRVLGASTQLVRRIQTAEALALGVLASGVGCVLSLAASWALVHWLFELPFQPPWFDLATLTFATLSITALFGAMGSRHAREQSPQAALRNSERFGTGSL